MKVQIHTKEVLTIDMIDSYGTNTQFPNCILLFRNDEISHIINMDKIKYIEFIEGETNENE